MFSSTESSALALASRATSRSASRSSSWIRVRSSSARRGRDLVAGAADRDHKVLGLVAQRMDAVDDRRVLLLDRVQVAVALEQVVEAVGLEDHRDGVGLVGLVDIDEPGREDVHRDVEALAKCDQVVDLTVEPRLGPIEALLHDRLAVAQGGHLADELVDVGGELLDLAGEDALLVLLLSERALLLVELALEVLRRRAGRGDEPETEAREGGRGKHAAAAVGRSSVRLCAHLRGCLRG